MSYKNFIPQVWAENINRNLEKAHVFVADCNKEYEGKVSKMGDTVHILGTGTPTITTQIGGDIELNGAETVPGNEQTLVIDHVSYFDYMIDDIDKRQAVGGVMDALSAETSQALADEQDKCVSALCADKSLFSIKEASLTTDNVLGLIDNAMVKLFENNVSTGMGLTATIPPAMWKVIKQAYVKADTDNSEMLKNGKVGQYGSVNIKMSNNVYKDKDGFFYVPVKTNKAFAFANPMTHNEPYRPEKRFSDAVKGYVLYGAKVVRPKECVILKVKIA